MNSYKSESKRQTTHFFKGKRLNPAPLRRGNNLKALEKVIRDMQKTTIRYHHSLTRRNKIKDQQYQVLVRT